MITITASEKATQQYCEWRRSRGLESGILQVRAKPHVFYPPGCDAVGAPAIQNEVDPVIPDAVAPMCDGDPDTVAPKIPLRRCFKDSSSANYGSGDSRRC